MFPFRFNSIILTFSTFSSTKQQSVNSHTGLICCFPFLRRLTDVAVDTLKFLPENVWVLWDVFGQALCLWLTADIFNDFPSLEPFGFSSSEKTFHDFMRTRTNIRKPAAIGDRPNSGDEMIVFEQSRLHFFGLKSKMTGTVCCLLHLLVFKLYMCRHTALWWS